VNDALLDMVLRWPGKSRSPSEAADLLLADLDGGQAVAARLDAAAEQRHALAQAVGTPPEPSTHICSR
jgi:hypothetical protein